MSLSSLKSVGPGSDGLERVRRGSDQMPVRCIGPGGRTRAVAAGLARSAGNGGAFMTRAPWGGAGGERCVAAVDLVGRWCGRSTARRVSWRPVGDVAGAAGGQAAAVGWGDHRRLVARDGGPRQMGSRRNTRSPGGPHIAGGVAVRATAARNRSRSLLVAQPAAVSERLLAAPLPCAGARPRKLIGPPGGGGLIRPFPGWSAWTAHSISHAVPTAKGEPARGQPQPPAPTPRRPGW